MEKRKLTLLAVGDLIFGSGPAETYFEACVDVLRSGDVIVGQLEVPYTLPYRDPEWLSALVFAGFNVVTLAGNHILDLGPQGVRDTLDWLSKNNILYTGAGLNIKEAKKPAILEKNGTTIGFLSYNCVGPREYWAGDDRPGCAYVKVITHYELDYACPGGPPTIYTFADPGSLEQMIENIQELKKKCDVVIVSLHKGLVHTPVTLADYEFQLSHAAIDAGADLVIGHHAHILKGIEVYKGKVVFHGLGNFVTLVPELMVKPGQDSDSWAVRRRKIFGFEPDPNYPLYPFHPEAKYTIIAKCLITEGRISSVRFIPCLINPNAQPEIKKNDAAGNEVLGYVKRITEEAGLNTCFKWVGGEVTIS